MSGVDLCENRRRSSENQIIIIYLGEGVKANNTPLVVESEGDLSDHRELKAVDLLKVTGYQRVDELLNFIIGIDSSRSKGGGGMTRIYRTLLLGDVVTRLENEIGIIFANDDIILDANFIKLLLALGAGRQAGGVLSDADSVEQMRAANKGEP